MKYRVVLTDRALSDLRAIRDYIARRSPEHAARFLESLLGQIGVLEITPNGFGKAQEAGSVSYDLRQFVVKPYRVLYRVTGRKVEILHVRHGMRRAAKPEEFRD